MQWNVVVLICLIPSNVYPSNLQEEQNLEWWKNAVIYQVYVRSFKDYNNDGFGDIRGIINKLDYFEATGINALCLSSIYQSADLYQNYDVTEYKIIDSKYGSLDDFRNLLALAQKKNIKILVEFIPNHTSKKHNWFQDEQFQDFYVWKEGKSPEELPNNWVSVHGGSAWSFDSVRQKWYLHQFSKDQPDLNLRNPILLQYMEGVLRYWLDLGVAGFRINSAQFLLEDPEFKDEEPASGNSNSQPGDYAYLNHKHTTNLDETYELIYKWREFIDKYNEERGGDRRVLIAEVDTNLEDTIKYYGSLNRPGAHIVTNLVFPNSLTRISSAKDFLDQINKWNNALQEQYASNWMLGTQNHERFASKFGTRKVDGLLMLLSFLPGALILYQGEEIGQENGENVNVRYVAATPFHWDGSEYAGFNDGSNRPWLPVSSKYVDNNLASQKRLGHKTHYNMFRKLLLLRKQISSANGLTKYSIFGSTVLVLTKVLPGAISYVTVINMANFKKVINLFDLGFTEPNIKILIASKNSKKHNRVISLNDIILDSYESFVAKLLPYAEPGDLEWWKNAVIYQIYPLSFKDSNNDGEGDLNGITSKLEYLRDLNITAIWLSPIFKSPNVDQGYDISDFKAIDKRFGKLEDFDELVRKAHQLGIKVLLDFVPNHSSDQHEWFLKSKKGDPDYKDFYVWAEGTSNNPPSNWISYFKGSSWECDNNQNHCYLHQYAKEQPDLNFRNPGVVEEMNDILRFWLDRNVDGFRVDAVKNLYENERFENEPLSGIPGVPDNNHDYLVHVHTNNLPETFQMVYSWRQLLDDYLKENGGDAKIMITEAYTDLANTMKYYGDVTRNGAHFAFNFQLITQLPNEPKALNVYSAISDWLKAMPKRYVANWVTGNHDNYRIATRFGPKNVDGFNMLLAFLPGVMITYNGEEIGQENGEVTWEQGRDPRACKEPPNEFEKWSRDFERTPFHWNYTINAGFNNGTESWLPVSKKFRVTNLEIQKTSNVNNHYNVYKKLMELRQNTKYQNGVFDISVLSTYAVGCTRSQNEDAVYVFLFNMGSELTLVNVKRHLDKIKTEQMEVIIRSDRSHRKIGELIPTSQIELDGHEALIAKIVSDDSLTTTESTSVTQNSSPIRIASALVVIAFALNIIINVYL